MNHDLPLLWYKTLTERKAISALEVAERAELFFEHARNTGDYSFTFAGNFLLYCSTHGKPKSINIMGTMGSGKSSLASLLAQQFNYSYRDADLFHTKAAKEKMQRGESLSTKDRMPFLEKVRTHLAQPKSITTCSAVRDSYRAYIAGAPLEVLDAHFQGDPWEKVPDDSGVLFITLVKPYATALAELDHATHHQQRLLQDGSSHYIRVTYSSPDILQQQYKAFEIAPVQPWIAHTIETERYRRGNKDENNALTLPSLYDLDAMTREISMLVS